jgi:hypothetical protein
MHPWETRLNDLARLLQNCESTYFDPELFRMNTNQFLQTSRTVTFIIQKHKSDISGFNTWYQANVLNPWAIDMRMTWARDSRNTIEKVGDLQLHSSLSTTLVIGYLEEADIRVEVGREELVRANAKRLIRFAEKALPSNVSRDAVVRIERKWIANTLPDWELLTALAYVYSRSWEVCKSLARHLGSTFPATIPSPSRFDGIRTDARKVRYVPLKGRGTGRLRSEVMPHDPAFQPPPKLAELFQKRAGKPWPRTCDELVDYHLDMAEVNFRTHGNHVPMLFMYGADGEPVDYITTRFDERSDKFLFWRYAADRLLVIKPKSVIWVAEAWLRTLSRPSYQPTDNLPIVGERLHLFAITDGGDVRSFTWSITRESEGAAPILGERTQMMDEQELNPTFLIPISRAFKKLRAQSK